ncbi:single-stranded nucleic acid-binding protein, partial [Haematococcus lacustris]
MKVTTSRCQALDRRRRDMPAPGKLGPSLGETCIVASAPALRRALACQVDGCSVNLAACGKRYFTRHRCCAGHMKACNVLVGGVRSSVQSSTASRISTMTRRAAENVYPSTMHGADTGLPAACRRPASQGLQRTRSCRE